MKKLLCLLAMAVALPIVSLGQDFTIIESDSHHLSLRFELNEFSIDTVRREGELMHVITTKGITVPNDYGEPDLPTFNRFVAIPQGAQAIIEVRPSRGERISGINIAPSVGSQCENETERPFYKEPKYYECDAMYPSSAVVMAEPQKMRGVDAVHLGISPVQFRRRQRAFWRRPPAFPLLGSHPSEQHPELRRPALHRLSRQTASLAARPTDGLRIPHHHPRQRPLR